MRTGVKSGAANGVYNVDPRRHGIILAPVYYLRRVHGILLVKETSTTTRGAPGHWYWQPPLVKIDTGFSHHIPSMP